MHKVERFVWQQKGEEMIPFTIGLIIGGLGGMAIMSCMAMAGRDDE